MAEAQPVHPMRRKISGIAMLLASLGGALAQGKGWDEVIPNWLVACVWIASAWGLAYLGVTTRLARSYYQWLRRYKKASMILFVICGAIIGGFSGALLRWAILRDYPPLPAHGSQENTVVGLRFTEATKPVPDEFVLDFGNNRGTFKREVLRQGIPFERLTGIRFGGTIPVSIYFDEKNIMKVDATIYDGNGQIGATIQNSNFTIRNLVWDRNWDAIAFELVDEKKIPLFQIERPKDNLIKLRGIFRTSEGSVLVVTDNGVWMNPSKPTAAPRALFRYPSAINLGNRAER